MISESEHHILWTEIEQTFGHVAAKIEHAIEVFANDDSGTLDLAALNRAKDLAQRSANMAGSARSNVRRAFD